MHAGALLLDAPGAEQVRVDLSLEVKAQPHILVDPVSIEKYDAVAGGPVEVEFFVSNTQRGLMDWTVSESTTTKYLPVLRPAKE